MVADMAADMKVHMVADMKVDKGSRHSGQNGYPIWQEEEKRVPNLVSYLVTGLVTWAQTFSTQSLPDLPKKQLWQ